MSAFSVLSENRVARIRLNAPPRNILTAALQAELRDAVAKLALRGGHNVLVIESVLDDFSTGADVAEHLGRDNVERMLEAAHGLIAEVLRHPVPVIAAVRGLCLGGAFELALACDQIIAAEDATLGLPEITLGCFPPAALVLGPLKLPPLLASELIFSGRTLPAAEMRGRGAGLRCVAAAGFLAAVDEAAAGYAELPRGPLVETTRLLRCGAAERFEAAIGGIEREYLERLLAMPEAEEGVRAFLEKRKPNWGG